MIRAWEVVIDKQMITTKSIKHIKSADAVVELINTVNNTPILNKDNQGDEPVSSVSAEPSVCVVIPVYDEDPGLLIASIKSQHGIQSDIFVAVGSPKRFGMLIERQDADYQFVKPNLNLTVGVRIASALNRILERVDLAKYDYLLRVDADAILTPFFIKACIEQDVDLVGEFGAMLMAMPAFRQVFHGRFPEVNKEDIYISLKMKSTNRLVALWNVPPIFRRLPGAGKPPNYFVENGLEMWKLGYEPFHVIWDALVRIMLRHEPVVLFQYVGYFGALINRKKRYEFAKYVTAHQLPHVFKNIRIRTKFHKLHLE